MSYFGRTIFRLHYITMATDTYIRGRRIKGLMARKVLKIGGCCEFIYYQTHNKTRSNLYLISSLRRYWTSN